MKAIKISLVMLALSAVTVMAQLGEPQVIVQSAYGGWSNAIGPSASATVKGQTNLTRIDVPPTTRSIAIEFDGYLSGASTAATNVAVYIRKSIAPQGNANGTWLTSWKAYTNTQAYVTWLVPIAAGGSRVYGVTNLNLTAGSGLEYYPCLYVHEVNLGFTDAAYMTNFAIRASYQKHP